MFIQKNKKEDYQDKRVFSIFGETVDDCMSRLCLVDFDNLQNYNDKIKRLCDIEKTRQVLTGKNVTTGLIAVAENYLNKGSVPTKQLVEFLRKLVLKNLNSVYPSSYIDFEIYKKCVQDSKVWMDDIHPLEADYASLLSSIILAKEKNNLDTVYIDSKTLNQQGFVDFAKEYINITFSNNADIIITDQFFDLNYVQMLLKTKCKVLVCFDEIGFLLNTIPINQLEKLKIHVIPPSVTKLGNFLIAEGIYNNNRNIEESFYLTQVLTKHLNNSLWDFALNSRENFYSVVEEIYTANINADSKNRFKLMTHGVGAMSYRAKI